MNLTSINRTTYRGGAVANRRKTSSIRTGRYCPETGEDIRKHSPRKSQYTKTCNMRDRDKQPMVGGLQRAFHYLCLWNGTSVWSSTRRYTMYLPLGLLRTVWRNDKFLIRMSRRTSKKVSRRVWKMAASLRYFLLSLLQFRKSSGGRHTGVYLESLSREGNTKPSVPLTDKRRPGRLGSRVRGKENHGVLPSLERCEDRVIRPRRSI